MFYVYDTQRESYLLLFVLPTAPRLKCMTWRGTKEKATAFLELNDALASYHRYGGFTSQVRDSEDIVIVESLYEQNDIDPITCRKRIPTQTEGNV